MISKSESERIYTIVRQEIKKTFPMAKGIYVFGSFASGEATKESDLDLAVLLDKPADKLKLWDCAQNIAIQIQRDVDLIDLLTASNVLQFQIMNSAKPIDIEDAKACDAFEDLSFVQYIRFNESRQEILEEIEKRGRIY